MDIIGEWVSLKNDVAACKSCRDGCGRLNAVGDKNARIMLVAKAPDYFCADGTDKLADFVMQIAELTELSAEGVFFTYLLCCPQKAVKTPFYTAKESCIPFLRRQFKLVSPEIIVAIGSEVAKRLIGSGFNPKTDEAKPIGKGKTMFFGVADPFKNESAAARDKFLNDILNVVEFCNTYPAYKSR